MDEMEYTVVITYMHGPLIKSTTFQRVTEVITEDGGIRICIPWNGQEEFFFDRGNIIRISKIKEVD